MRKAMNFDPAYYRQRYAAELQAADRAASPVARERHRELARLYLRELASVRPAARGAKAA
jgi:hypothetical protein